MKTLRILLCCLLCPVLLAIHAKGQGSDGEAMRGDVVARLTGFYTYYCHALQGDGAPLDHLDKLKPYVSARYLKELARLLKTEDGIEADPFVCAQDTDPAWEKNIKITNVKAAADGQTATANVTLGGMKTMIRHLKVSLVNEAGVYKVDKVKDADL